MPRDDRLFGDVVDPSIRLGTRRWYTVPLSVLVHALALAALVIAPLMATAVLPSPRAMLAFVPVAALPPPPPAPPAPAPRVPDAPTVEVIDRAAAPVEAPDEIRPEPPLDTTFDNPFGSGASGNRAGLPGGHPDGIEGGAPFAPPRPAPAPDPPPQAPMRVGGDIVAPVKTRDVLPRYPAVAQAAKVSGRVIIEATIGPDGRVQDARVLRSIPLLDEAALEAVRQWEFTPTLLNGTPVPVLMTVTVVFSLAP